MARTERAAMATDLVQADAGSAQRNALRVLSAGSVLGGVAVAGSIPAGALLAASIADSDAAAGLAQTAGVVGAAALALPLARIALSRGRRAALSLGYAIGGAGAAVVLAAALVSSLPLLLIGCLLVGVASASGYQARYAATDLAEEHHRARALSWVVWAGTIGAVIGPNLLSWSGALGVAVGFPRLAGPYIVSLVALGLAAAVIVVRLRPDPYLLAVHRREASGGPAPRPTLRDGLTHLRGRPLAVLGIGTIAIGHVVMVMVMVMTPVHMAHVDVTLQLIGLVISVHVAGMYALSPLVGWAVDRFGRIPVIGAGIAILVIACAISGLAPADAVGQLGIGLFLLGLGWSCTLIAGSALVTDAVEPGERPAVQGLSDLVMNGAGAIGGAAAGIIVAAGSYAALCGAAVVPLVGLTIWLALPACRARSNTRSI